MVIPNQSMADFCRSTPRGRTLPAHGFRQRRFFGTPTSLSFFPSPPGKVEKSHINKKAATVVVHPPLSTSSYEKPPNSWDSHSATDPLSPSPLNPSVSSEGNKDSCRSGAADRRPIVALVYSMIPLVSRFDLLHRRLILRFEFAVQLEVLIESTGAGD